MVAIRSASARARWLNQRLSHAVQPASSTRPSDARFGAGGGDGSREVERRRPPAGGRPHGGSQPSRELIELRLSELVAARPDARAQHRFDGGGPELDHGRLRSPGPRRRAGPATLRGRHLRPLRPRAPPARSQRFARRAHNQGWLSPPHRPGREHARQASTRRRPRRRAAGAARSPDRGTAERRTACSGSAKSPSLRDVQSQVARGRASPPTALLEERGHVEVVLTFDVELIIALVVSEHAADRPGLHPIASNPSGRSRPR